MMIKKVNTINFKTSDEDGNCMINLDNKSMEDLSDSLYKSILVSYPNKKYAEAIASKKILKMADALKETIVEPSNKSNKKNKKNKSNKGGKTFKVSVKIFEEIIYSTVYKINKKIINHIKEGKTDVNPNNFDNAVSVIISPILFNTLNVNINYIEC